MSTTALKKPTGVYAVAILFLIAPIGNILISFAGSGVHNWHDPSVFSEFLITVPFVDWLWLSLLFITGILLFRPHKLSWSVAIVTLLLVLSINAFRLYQVDMNSIDPLFLKIFSALAMLCTLSVLIISFYFRFPYLDRRSNWIGNTKRFDIRTNAVCSGVNVITESLSYTGCRMTFSEENTFDTGSTVRLKFPEISTLELEALIVEKLENGLRAEFKEKSATFKQDLSRWLKSR